MRPRVAFCARGNCAVCVPARTQRRLTCPSPQSCIRSVSASALCDAAKPALGACHASVSSQACCGALRMSASRCCALAWSAVSHRPACHVPSRQTRKRPGMRPTATAPACSRTTRCAKTRSQPAVFCASRTTLPCACKLLLSLRCRLSELAAEQLPANPDCLRREPHHRLCLPSFNAGCSPPKRTARACSHVRDGSVGVRRTNRRLHHRGASRTRAAAGMLRLLSYNLPIHRRFRASSRSTRLPSRSSRCAGLLTRRFRLRRPPRSAPILQPRLSPAVQRLVRSLPATPAPLGAWCTTACSEIPPP